MKHAGKARKAALKLILLASLLVAGVLAVGFLATLLGSFVKALTGLLLAGWALFVVFTLYFFRDPTPRVPLGGNLVLSPAHGKVDVIDTINEPDFMDGKCQRISMFLSVLDVHVQNAPIAGRIGFFKHSSGQFLNALKTESALYNENILIGFDAGEPGRLKIGVRLIAGAIARRIVPFVQLGDAVAGGDRISLIQFGSRADVYLPANARIQVKLGDHVVGGQSVLALVG